MMRTALALGAGTLLIAAVPPQKIVPAPANDRPSAPVGAAARAKNGPEPLARPSDDIGMADDPVTAPIVLPTPSPSNSALPK